MRTIISSTAELNFFIDRIRLFPVDKKRFIVEFKMYRRQRSLRQNKLYRLWLRCIKDETGNSEEALHLYFKEKYLAYNHIDIFGSEVILRQSTRKLDTKEFTEYLENIRVEMLEQGIYLPEPGMQGWDEFYIQYGLK
jgi:hypothetical protein